MERLDYKALFDELNPGFFQSEGIRNLPEDRVFEEMVLDLHGFSPEALRIDVPEGIAFGWYRGELAPLREAVKEVSSNWPEYFTEKSRVYCAMDGDEVASFCLVDDWGTHFGLRVGAPGCVGTVPRYRRRGIGLRMVQLATGILAREGFDLSWIHYTGVAPWYARLGYETVLRWNARGPV